jgi:4-aminobutyrate aminotransferase-like enzyme
MNKETIQKIVDKRIDFFPRCLYYSFKEPLLVQTAKDQYYNNDILDLYNNVSHVGHSNKKIADVISKEYNTVNINTRYLQENLQEYTSSLFEHIKHLKHKYKMIFVNSGSEANDLALRISLLYRNSENNKFISLKDSYHGTTYLCDKVSNLYPDGKPKNHDKNDKNDVIFINRNDIKSLDDLFQNRKLLEISSIILETIQGVAGNYPLSQEFIQKLFYYASRDKIITICDEVQTGFGRTGESFWSFDYHQVVPDIITCGKSIANGYPMGAVIIREDLADLLGYSYFNTFGGNSVSCAVAKTVLEEIKEKNLISHSKQMGDYLIKKLNTVKGVDNITGRGLFIGFNINLDIDPKEIIEKLKDNKIIIGIGKDDRFRIKPPLVITQENIDYFIEILSSLLSSSLSS